MRAEANRHMAPLFIHNREGVMVNIGKRFLLANSDKPVLGFLHIDDRSGGARHHATEKPGKQRVLGDEFFGGFVLARFRIAKLQGDVILPGIGGNTPAEVACKAHQVCFIEKFVGTAQLPPPGTETPRDSEERGCRH